MRMGLGLQERARRAGFTVGIEVLVHAVMWTMATSPRTVVADAVVDL